jgi:hypothetical protein
MTGPSRRSTRTTTSTTDPVKLVAASQGTRANMLHAAAVTTARS